MNATAFCRRTAGALLAAALPIVCIAGPRFHLESATTLDAFGVDKESGRLQVVLLVDKPLADPTTKKLADRKLQNYCRAKRSGSLFAMETRAKATLPVELVVFHLSFEREEDDSVLASITRGARRCAFEVKTESRKSIFKP
ncbi:MAG: hypothetical protein ACRCWJ_17065 [Casimicrobium sp.]